MHISVTVNILYIFSSIRMSIAPVPTTLMVTRVGPCYDKPSPTVTVDEFGLTTKTYDTTLSGDINITEDIENGWNVKGTMKKCLDMRNIDTCDYFKSFLVVKDGCVNFVEDDEEIYAILFHYVEPRLSCPLKAGKYTISNFPLFTEDNYVTVHESKISTSVFGYTLRLDGHDRLEREIFCVEAYLQLLYMREHSWIKGKAKKHMETATEAPSDENEDEYE